MLREPEIVLESKGITKHYLTDRGTRFIACSDVSLKLEKGKTLGIVGESGSGKSTFAKMVMRMEEPTAGEILYRGKDMLAIKGEELRQHRRNIQMVFQDPYASFNPRMRVEDILTEPLLNFGLIKRSEKTARAKALLRMVELPEDYHSRLPHHMSGGQRQRISIARALALEPEILICDEATSALDVSIQKAVVELLVKLQRERGISMIFICHDLALVQSLSHSIAVMHLGSVVECLSGDMVANAKTPYTKKLLEAIFPLAVKTRRS